MSNTITAFFNGRVGVCESLYQYDYGMVMVLDGVMFDTVFDAYFSTTGEEDAIPVIGKYNRIAIPDSCLQRPGIVTLHIPIHEGQNDSEVEYIVTFRVIGRARPEYDGTSEESTAIAKALAVLQDIQGDVSTWLDAHPEATTTVLDGAITYAKLADAVKTFVTPEMFGAKGDGVTDDTAAIQAALDSNKGVKGDRSKSYLINSTLTYSIPSSEGAKTFSTFEDMNLVAGSGLSGNPMLKVKIYEPNNRMKIADCYFDCNSLASSGIKVEYCANLIVDNVTVNNPTEKAFHIVDGYELFMSDCYAKNENEVASLIGYYISCTDSILMNCISKNFSVGFYTDEGSIKFIGCHPWNNLNYYKANSVGFRTYNNPTFESCEIDTCTIGVDVHEYYNVWFNNCHFLYNYSGNTSDVYYIYAETSTVIYMSNCYMRAITSGGNHNVTNRQNSVRCIHTIIQETNGKPKLKNNVATLDMLYNLVIANGTAVTIAANSSVTKTFTVQGVTQGDLVAWSVMYDDSACVYKLITDSNTIKIIIANPTSSPISISWCTIHAAVFRDSTTNLSYTSVDAN